MLQMPEAEFERHYQKILDNLDPAIVLDELGRDSILLCWEKFNECCHRRMVAEWLETNLSIEIPEFGHARGESLTFAATSQALISKQRCNVLFSG
jgi:hypothetical protein